MTPTDTPATPASSRIRGSWRRLRPDSRQRAWLARDGLLAVAAVAVETVLVGTAPPGLAPWGWPGWAFWSVLCAAPITLRRVAPWWAVLLAVPIFVGSALTGAQPVTAAATFVLLTYTTAALLPLRQAALAAGAIWGPAVAVALAEPPPPDFTEPSPAYLVFTQVLLALVCFFVGRTVHARRATILALEERARVAEENQRSLADQAVADERRRIARELHDVVAHHVSVMGVLATGARRVLSRDPTATDGALGTIEETSRTTLRELRRLLDVLRTDAEPAAELSPQPGLAGIEALVEQVREAGLPVTLRVDGTPGPLDPGVALTVFRIVQEALTNTLKHAGAATAQVRLSFGVYWLIVEVADTGRGPAPEGGRLGHGLVGMRERMALYGGTLRTGPRPGGGYRVYAKMPMEQLGAPISKGAA
ncbi:MULTISPECIES: sensor histidine kinase [unclassified Plantactinospora]|uniref:sensor histidine kinase n=1 Tax=unclassified Plantactinospora TaxID=2631981 RepID=UPI000D170D61|nr:MULTISPECIES: sensor histidine kinase [unclassified Plantactinospora]AVT28650.1 sensor histidine kinase [Plantactinospora sp. BC1]AVT38107.1 sensor histidine kinase [Plantactinospora sp. BB1]